MRKTQTDGHDHTIMVVLKLLQAGLKPKTNKEEHLLQNICLDYN